MASGIPYTKEMQIGKKKEKKKGGFGKRPSRGSFGKKKSVIKSSPTKVKKTDVIDEDYRKWLRTQPCVVTGRIGTVAHHIFGRNPSRNDYLEVPLMPYVHNVEPFSYHECGNDKFIEHWNIDLGEYKTIKKWFNSMVLGFVLKYEAETCKKIDRALLNRNR